MTFKGMLREDIRGIFLNPDEFGETHTVNGRKDVLVVTDDFELLSREKYHKNVTNDGTSRNRGILYVRASDVGRLPKAGQQLTIDGMHFRVEQAVNETGLYAVTVQAVR